MESYTIYNTRNTGNRERLVVNYFSFTVCWLMLFKFYFVHVHEYTYPHTYSLLSTRFMRVRNNTE